MNAVTGALSYTGRAIAEELLRRGERVVSLFRGKHRVEQWREASDLDWAVVRPTLVFGPNDILVNNIAWILRRLPLFLVPRPADCLVQPVSVRDVARIAVDAEEGSTQDAAGPEVHEFRRLVELIGTAVGSRARILAGPRRVALATVRVGNAALRDVVVTRDELSGLGRSLLTSSAPPRGQDRVSTWLTEHADALGRRYESELERNFRGQE